ncbi:Pex19 protein family-domain-containing protein [Myxozyma melibiosi]|uniref:Pex19 protein family-domain-containing protein n=1 Tax=Myxozyma melibiosi TaxID=54550 RepID=A0ABR1EZ66_9ASCO
MVGSTVSPVDDDGEIESRAPPQLSTNSTSATANGDEDDLDDLDDLLDEFTISPQTYSKSKAPTAGIASQSQTSSTDSTSTTTLQNGSSTPSAPHPPQPNATTPTSATTHAPAPSTTAPSPSTLLLDPETEALDSAEDEFARQLEQGFESMLAELETDPESRRNFEAIMSEIGKYSDGGGEVDDTVLGVANAAAVGAGAGKGASKDTLQDAIAKTMERMKESGDKVDREIIDGNGGMEDDDFLAAMMKQLEQAAVGGEGGGEGDQAGGLGSDEDLTQMLSGMMEQLTSKEILYEPMKELDDKYSDWLASNRGTLDAEEAKRFEAQRVVVREIVVRFEKESYSDEDPDDRRYIAEKMQLMQESGSPPADIMGEMGPAGMDLNDLGSEYKRL